VYKLIFAITLSILPWSILPQDNQSNLDKTNEIEEFLISLDWKQSGTYRLPKSSSTLSLPAEYFALFGEDANKYEEVIMGIPRNNIEAVVFVGDSLNTRVWFESYDSGYVHLDDWSKVDPEKLLEVISQATEKNNEKLKSQGIEEMHVIGWIQPPTLDRNSNTIYWAFEAREGEEEVVNSVAIRLGRKGYEKLVWITYKAMYIPFGGELDIMLRAHSFDPGFRYKDYTTGDQVANYGIATLVAATLGGKIAKAGGLSIFFKKISAFIFAAIAALYYKFKNLFKGKNDE